MSAWPYNTGAWQRLRRAHLSLHPLCEACAHAGRTTPANHVDHRKPISAGGEPFPDHPGLASLCAPCHSRKTARGSEAGAIRTDKPMKGCDVTGWPLDPSHPWNAEKSLRAEPIGAARSMKTQLVTKSNRPHG